MTKRTVIGAVVWTAIAAMFIVPFAISFTSYKGRFIETMDNVQGVFEILGGFLLAVCVVLGVLQGIAMLRGKSKA